MAGDNHEERQARSLALEKAYVHDVYDQIAPHFTDTRYRPWPRVKQFLLELEPGSLVADVGCGNGKYLDINPDLMKIGSDRCAALTSAARAKNFEVLTSDNLHMPFRDETFDAVLSIAVIHHFATTDRRVAAIKELTRVLRIGGKVLITVWAMEQRHRKFDSQDVLVPWHEPVKSSSEDRGSSVERELTSTTTSDDDVLVYHAYSHISDSESHQHSAAVNRKRQKYRNGRGRYRSADSAIHCRRTAGTSSQSSSELSSPNETCYSFVRRAFQKLSNSTPGGSPYDTFAKRSPARPYFYRSCRKPCVSESMEFGKSNKDSAPGSPRNEFCHQDSLDSEYPDPTTEDDIPIELRHLEGYETCKKCGTPAAEFGNCEQRVCISCLPADPDTGKKSRSLGDFLNMIPKLLRVKKCEKEPMSDLHKRISTASDPREYVVKTRGGDVNGIVRSKSTVSMMSRLEELMSMSPTSGKDEPHSVANPNCSAGPRSKAKPSLLQSFTSTVLVEGSDGSIEIRDSSEVKNLRRYNSPADALEKLRQDVILDEPFEGGALKKCDGEKEINSPVEKKLQNSEFVVRRQKSSLKSTNSSSKDAKTSESVDVGTESSPPEPPEGKELKTESDPESHLSSYFSMPELYKLTHDQIPEEPIINSQKQRHISFYEQAQNIFADTSSESNDLNSGRRDSPLNYATRERTSVSAPQRGLVKRSLSVDTGDNSSSSHQTPRRFSASAAQGVLASALRTYSLPRSCSRGSSVKSDTSVDSEESIVSVIPRKGNSITSDTSVDSEESVISVIQRSTSEIDTLSSQNGLRNNISRFGSRSAQASPVTVLSSQTSSAESSPPQSGKNDGRFPGSAGVIDQLMQQQQLLYSPSEALHSRPEGSDHSIRTRRCLLRPISDPKIEEKLSTPNYTEEFSNGLASKPNNNVQIPKFNQGSLALVESDKSQVKEKTNVLTKSKVAQIPPVKPLVPDVAPNWQTDKKEQTEGELSQTPSPVGPFQYITDPLITGIDSTTDVPTEVDQTVVSSSEAESKFKSIRFNTEVTNLEEYKAKLLPDIRKPPNGFIESVLKNTITKKGIVDINSSETTQIVAVVSNSVEINGHTPALSEDSKELLTNKDERLLVNVSTSSNPEDHQINKSKDNDMRKSFFKLRERLESLASSQNSIQNFEIFKNVSHSFGSLRNIKEKIESEATANEGPRENKISPTPKSLNDSRQSSLDESSQVTLSDESVMSVEGTSSVSDENDYKKTDDDEENPDSSQNLTVKKVDGIVANSSTSQLNVLTDAGQSSQRQVRKCDSCAEKCGSALHKPSKAASFSDTELHLKKGGVRCPLRKRLRRSCVTIDEVECREFVSSEDTSPSSSVSLEWNDFDRIETDSSAVCAACGSSCQITTIVEDGVHRDEPSIAICCEDVNVAETETKFNIVDKEMCVFFETPSSSIGKSASSSSNATDFSTTSDRFRGVMQREKSDDRSSKESDSDNLSKLSDVEGRSDSAFSEDFAKKTDPVSSSSSASLEVLESVRTKLNNDGECDGALGSSKQTSNWVLDNIDEIPDDDQNHDDPHELGNGLDKFPSSSWKPEKSMDFAQRRENFFSCAADCRDMYRISFDDKAKGMKENSVRSVSSSEVNDPILVGMAIPDIAPGLMELFPPRKNQEDDEQTTGILAELVGTLSGISSLAFGDIYPKQEAKIEDFSSDESVGISTFERVLTSGATTHSKNRPKKSSGHQKEKGCEEAPEKRSNNKKSTGNGTESTLTNGNPDSIKSEIQNMGQAFVKLPPENGIRLYSESNKANVECQELERNIQNSESKTEKISNGTNATQPVQNEKKIPERLKILNRTSQSVCLDRVRQSSFEKDDESLQSTQSAPCSPRMKPRQRSVEEVLTSSRNELSRNSSLSQSTSQESLPGNETGGLMSYHRYYHVFRQGELDNLIETHVDNLHIISSYYDHANWCVVAEKVQVWTI